MIAMNLAHRIRDSRLLQLWIAGAYRKQTAVAVAKG
jgi:hypothetical protein